MCLGLSYLIKETNMANEPQKEKSGLEHVSAAAGAVKGAIKAGKALAGAAKGAALGPYGLAAGLAWEGRKVIGKVIIVVVALLLLPVMILMMLPSMLFGGLGGGDAAETVDDAVWDESIVEEALINDYSVVTEHYAEACTAVDTVMQTAHADVLAEIQADFAGYGENDTMTLNDPYAASLPHDSTRIICEYSALTDFTKTIKVNDLTKKLTEYSDNFFFYMVVEKAKVKKTPVPNDDGTYTEVQTPYTQVNYTVIYLGDDYITEDVFGLTEEQRLLAADFADSLSLYLDGGDESGTTN